MDIAPRTSAVQSIARAAAILRCFGESQELGITEISRLVGLHKSTTAGLVNTLALERILEKNAATGKYRLGFELYRIAASSKPELARISEPHLDRLLELTGETVNLAVRDGSDVIYIGKKESMHSIRIFTSVGKRMPVYCTAIGKAIFAFLPEDEVRRCMGNARFERRTEQTIADVGALMEELRHIRAKGIAYDYEEWERGLICVAAPVFDREGAPICAVSVSGPSMRMGEGERREAMARLLEATRAIGEEARAMDIQM